MKRRLALGTTALLASALLASNAESAPRHAHATARPHGIATMACKGGYYKNVSGNCVHRPSTSPIGATARCRDGVYSYSQHASGTCSGHGGVATWIHHP